MIGEGRIPDQHFFALEGRNSIADHLGRVCWDDRANGSAELFHSGANMFGNASDVVVDVLGEALSFRRSILLSALFQFRAAILTSLKGALNLPTMTRGGFIQMTN